MQEHYEDFMVSDGIASLGKLRRGVSNTRFLVAFVHKRRALRVFQNRKALRQYYAICKGHSIQVPERGIMLAAFPGRLTVLQSG